MVDEHSESGPAQIFIIINCFLSSATSENSKKKKRKGFVPQQRRKRKLPSFSGGVLASGSLSRPNNTRMLKTLVPISTKTSCQIYGQHLQRTGRHAITTKHEHDTLEKEPDDDGRVPRLSMFHVPSCIRTAHNMANAQFDWKRILLIMAGGLSATSTS